MRRAIQCVISDVRYATMPRMKGMFLLSLILLLGPIGYGCADLDWMALHDRGETNVLDLTFVESLNIATNVDELYCYAVTALNAHSNLLARRTFNRLLELDADLVPATWGVGEVHRRLHNHAASRAVLDQVVALDPGFLPAWLSSAYLRYVQGGFKPAMKDARVVLDAGRDACDLANYTRAYLVVGGAKGMLADKGSLWAKIRYGPGILSTLRKGEALYPESAEVKLGLGTFLMLAPSIIGGDLEEAHQYLLEAIETDPLQAEAHARLAQTYKRKGDDPMFEHHLTLSLTIDPGNEIALDIRNGGTLFGKGSDK